jgi:hypothetical protein
MKLSGRKITIAILSYYCNRKTNYEIRQGKLYLAVVPEEFRHLLLQGSGGWEGNGVMYNLNLSDNTTEVSEQLTLRYNTSKECFNDLWRWLMDVGTSNLVKHFGRADSLVVEADEAVGNGVMLTEWARKIGRRLKIPLDKRILPVSVCADLEPQTEAKKNSRKT